VIVALGITLVILPDTMDLIAGYGHFFLLGVAGASVANSTGSGGGIIFIPFFDALGLTVSQSVGTSIIIQCFGMTVGGLTWLASIQSDASRGKDRKLVMRYLLMHGGFFVIMGVLAGQYLFPDPPFPVISVFRYFSILFGLILLALSLGRSQERHYRHRLTPVHKAVVSIVCLLGGIVTAWISIGVGEWIAVALLFLGFPTMLAVAAGVCLSSIAVLVAAYHEIYIAGDVVWKIILFAAPAAMIGGGVARFLAVKLGAARLKIFLATWILVTGLVM